MNKISCKLTVYFENPFWVGVFERIEDEQLSVCKVTFGAEPKDYDVWEFVLKHYRGLKFSSDAKIEVNQVADNPKRRQRKARKQLQTVGIGTKSQQALKIQHEEIKSERKQKSREQRIAKEQLKFELKQRKKKEKHKGH